MLKENNIISNEQNKKRTLSLLILLGLLLILVGFTIWFFTAKDNKTNTVDDRTDKQEETDGERELLDKKSKEKIDNFLNIIVGSNDYIKYHFTVGDASFNIHRIYVVIHSIFENDKYKKLTSDNLPSKYKNDENYKQNVDNGCIIQASFDDISLEYQNVFGYEPKFNHDDWENVSPILCIEKEKIFDEELKMMLFNTCACSEGEADIKAYLKKYKYTYDNDYYYLYLHVGYKKELEDNITKFYKLSDDKEVDVDSFDGNEDKFDSVKWTFDKNFKFLKSEIIN